MSNNKNMIILSGIPFNCDENEIINFIFSFGNFNIDLINIKPRKGKKSFAYIKFKYPNESVKAITLLNNQKMNGSNITVKHFIPKEEKINRNNLYISNLPNDFTEEELFEIFSKFGKISMLSINKNPNNDYPIYAQINYENIQDANNAIDIMNNYYIKGKNINITYYLSQDNINNNNTLEEDIVPMLKIDNLPNSLNNEDILKNIFEVYGKIQKYGILNENNNNIGIIIYSKKEEAENAKEGMKSKLNITLIPIDKNIIEKIENSKNDNSNQENSNNNIYYHNNRYNNKMSSSTSITTSTSQSFIYVKNECNTLMIKNLPKDINENDLKVYFSQFGVIKKIKILKKAKLTNVTNEKGEIINKQFIFESLGKAIIIYKTISSAKLAKNSSNEKEILIKDNLIKCDIDYVEKKMDPKKYHNLNITQISQPISFYYSSNNITQLQNGNNNNYNNDNINYNSNNNTEDNYSSPSIHNNNHSIRKITVESENLIEIIKKILQIENIEERTEALGETLYYFLIKYINQYKLNITKGKCDDEFLCSRLTGILIKTNQETLLQIFSKTTRLYNAIKEVLLNLMQKNQLIK